MADLTGMMQAAAGSAGGGLAGGDYLAVGSSTAPRFTLLSHSSGSLSLATTYTVTGLSFGVQFSPTGEYIAVAHSTSPYFTLLDHTTPGTLVLADTVNTVSNGREASFSPDGNYIAVARANSFAPDRNFSLLNSSNPASVSISTTYALGGASGDAWSVSFSPDGAYIACAHTADARFTLLNRSGGSVSLAATYTFTNTTYGTDFSYGGDYIAVLQTTSAGGAGPGFTLLDHTTPGSVSLAATYTLLPGGVYISSGKTKFSPDDDYIAVTYTNGDNFTLLNHTTPGTVSLAATYVVGAAAWGISFTPDGNYIAVAAVGNGVLLLDHTTPGTVTLASTYAAAGSVYSVNFNPTPPAP